MDARPVTSAGGAGLSAQLVNGHWYRVAAMTPQLRTQLRVHAHRYRGQVWYVVEDCLNSRYHRFDRRAWRIISLLDGALTLEQLWLRLAHDTGAETPTQEDILALLGQLHGLDLLASASLPDLAESAPPSCGDYPRRRHGVPNRNSGTVLD